MTPAPTELAPPVMGQALPVELMSTVWADRHGVHDSLATDAGAVAWLAGLGERLPARTVLKGQARQRVRELRDAVRRVAAHVTSDPRERAVSSSTDVGGAVETINAAAARAPAIPALAVTKDGGLLARSRDEFGEDAVLSSLAAAAIEFFGSSEAENLNACLAPNCVLYFVKDHPRREWCSSACGNRARAARHYARHGRRSIHSP
jgi:predicted RNA-binding Zn ribbon-like protein